MYYLTACNTTDRRDGICINIKNCKPLLTLLQNPKRNSSDEAFLIKSKCGSEGKDPLVCCPKTKTIVTSTSTQSPSNDEAVFSSKLLTECGSSNFSSNRIVGGKESDLGKTEIIISGIVMYFYVYLFTNQMKLTGVVQNHKVFIGHFHTIVFVYLTCFLIEPIAHIHWQFLITAMKTYLLIHFGNTTLRSEKGRKYVLSIFSSIIIRVFSCSLFSPKILKIYFDCWWKSLRVTGKLCVLGCSSWSVKSVIFLNLIY